MKSQHIERAIQLEWRLAIHMKLVQIFTHDNERDIQRTTINKKIVKSFVALNPDMDSESVVKYLDINEYAFAAALDPKNHSLIYHYFYVKQGPERHNYADILNYGVNTKYSVHDIATYFNISKTTAGIILKYKNCCKVEAIFPIAHNLDEQEFDCNSQIPPLNNTILYATETREIYFNTNSQTNITNNDDMQIDEDDLRGYFLPVFGEEGYYANYE